MSDSDSILNFGQRALEQLAGLAARLTVPEASQAHASTDETSPEWLEIWKSGASQWAPRVAAPTDVVCTPEQCVELSASLPAMDRLLTREVLVFAGQQPLGAVPVGLDGMIRAPYRATRPGLHPVSYRKSAKGQPKGAHVLAHHVQVVRQETPVIAVDLDLLRDERDFDVSHLSDLVERGLELFYFDLHGQEGLVDLWKRIHTRQALPASVVTDISEPQLTRFGVDFDGVLFGAMARRLVAQGVGLSGVVSTNPSLAHSVSLAGWNPVDTPLAIAAFAADARAVFDRATKHRTESTTDVAFRLDVMTDTTVVEGNACRVELSNRPAREEVFAAIEGASSHVCLQFYILEEGRFAEELSFRLIRKARQGVQIRLLVDALYSLEGMLGTVNPLVEGLNAEPNIVVLATDRIESLASFDARAVKERDHRKVILVDDRVAFVGGRNAGDAYYYGFDEVPILDFTSHERIPWLDAHVRLEGPIVGEVRASFEEAWNRSDGDPLPAPKTGTSAVCGSDRCRLIVHDGVQDTNALGAYEAIIESAQASIFVVNAFPVFRRLADSIRHAVQRGVQVTMITGNAKARRLDGTFFRGPLHRELFDYMLKQRLEPLIRDGVKMYEYTTKSRDNIVARGGAVRPYVHAKILVADAYVASIGSANLDATASYWEREANIVIEGGDVPQKLDQHLQEICRRSYPLSLDSDYWRREKPQREIAARLWPNSLYS